MDNLTQKRWMLIHRVIHNPKTQSLVLDHKTVPVLYGSRSGCRMVKWNNLTFVEQNQNTHTEYATRARNGEQITWVIPKTGRWGLISGSTIKRTGDA